MYPLNWPLSKVMGAIGIPLLIKIEVSYDADAKVYFASSPTVKGLNIEADSLDDVKKEVELTLPELLELNGSYA